MVSKKLKIHTGIKGGKYYIKDGKKIYIKMNGGGDEDFYAVINYLKNKNLKTLNGIEYTIKHTAMVNGIEITRDVIFNANIELISKNNATIGVKLTFIRPIAQIRNIHNRAMANYRERSSGTNMTNLQKNDALMFDFLRLFKYYRFIQMYYTTQIYVYKPSLYGEKSVSFWKSLKTQFKLN